MACYADPGSERQPTRAALVGTVRAKCLVWTLKRSQNQRPPPRAGLRGSYERAAEPRSEVSVPFSLASMHSK
jgi:hypothetical protein